MHVVIASRSDPPLALARLRARGELTELRAADLRFTLDEASAFLREMSLDLSAGDTATLEQRTEGWIAGLKLAALSMKGAATCAGSSTRSPATIATSPTISSTRCCSPSPNTSDASCSATAILDRLNGPLCDAVTGERDGRRCSKSSSAGTSSSSRSTIGANGIATITSSRTCSRSSSSVSGS